MSTASPLSVDMDPAPKMAGERLLRWGLVTVAHGALLYGLLHASFRPETETPPATVSVRLLPLTDTKPPAPPPPPRPAPPVHKTAAPVPQPILAAAPHAETPAAFTVQAQAPAPVSQPGPAPVSAPAPAAPAIVAARFDADYLHNPKPVYPAFSRRNGEEGKVLLRVKVSAAGTALEVEIKQSCGYPRLDTAAREAVTQWRFTPAKRGDEAIESWVMVPITFALD